MPRPVEIRLSPSELYLAVQVGVTRQLRALRYKMPDRHGLVQGTPGWALHIEGACGELAVARHLGVFWDLGMDRFKMPDVGDLHVRTRSRHDYDLIVRKDDPREGIYVLVTGTAPVFHIRGWMAGAEAQSPCFLAAHGGREEAYFVPADELYPLSELTTTV